MKVGGRTLRRLRQAVQAAFFLLFCLFFLPGMQHLPLPFLRLDPLVALTASLTGGGLVAGAGMALLTVVLTLVFGRAWCGWICPLGTLLDWFAPRRTTRQPAPAWRRLKYLLLVLLLGAALLGNQSLLFLDPVTLMERSFGAALVPAFRHAILSSEAFLYRFEFLWPLLDWLHTAVVLPLAGRMTPVFAAAVLLALFLAAVVALNLLAERFWCRYVCPLGGLLGLLARFSLLRRAVNAGCTSCAACARGCPTGTIDAERGFASDPAECTVCLQCLEDCRPAGTAFRWQIPGWKPAAGQAYDPSRRQALTALGAAAAGAALAGTEPLRRVPPVERILPPGGKLTAFDDLCIRCGDCVRVCPTHGLQPALLESGWQNLFTPRLVPRLGYCDYNCTNCSRACPSGAIPPLSLEEKRLTPIGLARIDSSRCLPWAYNTPCSVCEESCPLPQKAIRQQEVEVVDAQGASILLKRPYVLRELCIGCGICENHCPMGGEAAVRVFTPTETGYF